MNTILLSAGFGNRFRPYTSKLAKPAIPFLNLPLIGYSLYYAQKWGCQKIAINTHHLPDTILKTANKLCDGLNFNLNFLNEQPNILDSGGGIKNAEAILNKNKNFLVFNSDIPHTFPDFDFNKLCEFHNNNNALVTFVTCDVEGLGESVPGIWVDPKNNKVFDAGLGPKKNLTCRHYSGVMLVSKELLNLQPSNKPHNIIYDLILPAIKKTGHHVQCFHLKSHYWYETGNCNSYLNASFKVLDHLIENPNNLYSQELFKIFNFFNIKNYLINNTKYKILYKNKFYLDEFKNLIHGHLILGDVTKLPTTTKKVSNCVINKNIIDDINLENSFIL